MNDAQVSVLETEGLPSLPRYNIEKIFERLEDIKKATESFIGRVLEGETYHRFCALVSDALPGQLYKGTIRESCLDLLGSELTEKTLHNVSWRLAAGHKQLKELIPVVAWTRQLEPEWMPLQIGEVVKHRRRDGLIRAKLVCRVLAGSAASHKVTTSWSHGLCAAIAKDLGFSRPYGSYPFVDVTQLTNMRFYGYFTPELCLEGPAFEKIRVSSTHLRHNMAYAKKRTLQNPAYDCEKQLPCHVCHVGYDTCPNGTHPRTYQWLRCGACGRDDWHDPRTVKLGKCVRCLMQR